MWFLQSVLNNEEDRTTSTDTAAAYNALLNAF